MLPAVAVRGAFDLADQLAPGAEQLGAGRLEVGDQEAGDHVVVGELGVRVGAA
ncbi:MAG TPA: hypothetical protein VI138_07585 [Candidatus Dormibacteraeota bacterium]